MTQKRKRIVVTGPFPDPEKTAALFHISKKRMRELKALANKIMADNDRKTAAKLKNRKK